MRSALGLLSFALLYVAESGDFSVANAVIALLVGALGLMLFRAGRPLRRHSQDFRISRWARFVVALGSRLFKESFRVLLVTLGIVPWRRVGYIRVPCYPRSGAGVALFQWCHTATPGSTFVITERARRVMVFSLIDAADAEASRNDLLGFYEREQRSVAP